jgi:hypothetical protein
VYSRQINGEVYEFGVSGKLVMNVLVMYDRQTESLWSQILGRAIEGPLTGTELAYFPSWQTTWQDWRTRYPDTLALVKGYVGQRDPYLSYYDDPRAGVIGETVDDDRLNTKQFVVGVAIGDQAVAFPFSVLNEQPVVNYLVGDVPVLVVFDEENASGVVFDRRIEGQELEFEIVDGFTLRDTLTGSLWDGRTGEAIEGDYAGTDLERVRSTSSFWFGWKDFYPDTEVYGIE